MEVRGNFDVKRFYEVLAGILSEKYKAKITAVAALAYVGAVCSTDSLDGGCGIVDCLIICAISGTWLVLFCIANNWFEQEDGEEDEPWDM